ncbi:hypothetical protein [Pseudomonas sp. DP-17]|uniref:hypothetical protein n=1 Tax=Pseudomonas sp. DP-17 TaxID=1580486 RepID=UPI001EFACEF3|nr:hypothetical protein [Pseudomonas sp. DP-17]MCG8911025.1 hypothetical protein [Pseudomonas sp. DP-17]
MKQLLNCILAAGTALLLTLLTGCDFLEIPIKAQDIPSQDGKYVQFFFGETGDTLYVKAAVVAGGKKHVAEGSAKGIPRSPIGRISLIQVDFEACGRVSFGQNGHDQSTVIGVQDPNSSIPTATCPIASWSGEWSVIRK